MKIILTAALALLIFAGCDENDTTQIVQKKEDIQKTVKPASIMLQKLSGENIEVIYLENSFIFKGYENRVVLLNFFDSTHLPSKAELSNLNTLQEKYVDDLKIINISDPDKSILSFISKNHPKSTENMPLMLIFDRDGNYSKHYEDTIPVEMIEVDIKRVL